MHQLCELKLSLSVCSDTEMNKLHTSQVGTFWQDDLQSVVHMDIGQGQEIAATSSNSYNGTQISASK